jgi:aryl-alcohol dehydrogenase-like predicted oxidoreductase
MQTTTFGALGKVSRLTLGGGGIGQVWGDVSRDEAIATIRLAVDEGIDLIDAAPGYKVCEALIGEAFDGKLPTGVRITTKCGVVGTPPDEVYGKLRASLDKSLRDMRLDRVDLMFLHNEITPDDFVYPEGNANRGTFASTSSLYREAIVPAFERLVSEGLIGAWGITGVSVPEAILRALGDTPKPAAVQAVANLLDSPGGLMRPGMGPTQRSREIIATAVANGVGVMGIRAVQAGALTEKFDRPMEPDNPDLPDFERAAPFRELCREWGESPAVVAHRYALTITGVDTVVLGVKNTAELREALAAEAAGPLVAEQTAAIDALGLRA